MLIVLSFTDNTLRLPGIMILALGPAAVAFNWCLVVSLLRVAGQSACTSAPFREGFSFLLTLSAGPGWSSKVRNASQQAIRQELFLERCSVRGLANRFFAGKQNRSGCAAWKR
jgi:hypothetical protein